MLTFYSTNSGLATGKTVKNHVDWIRNNWNHIVGISIYETSMYSLFQDEFARNPSGCMLAINTDLGVEAYMFYNDRTLAHKLASYYFAFEGGGEFSTAPYYDNVNGTPSGKRFDHYTYAATERAMKNGTWKKRRSIWN